MRTMDVTCCAVLRAGTQTASHWRRRLRIPTVLQPGWDEIARDAVAAV